MLFPEARTPDHPDGGVRLLSRHGVAPTRILPDDAWPRGKAPSQIRRCHLLRLRLWFCSRDGHLGRHLPGRSSHAGPPARHFRLCVFVRVRWRVAPPLRPPSAVSTSCTRSSAFRGWILSILWSGVYDSVDFTSAVVSRDE